LLRLHAQRGLPPPPEPGPCEGCGTRSSCAKHHLACERFAIFVDVGGLESRWGTAPREPSRIVYDRLFTAPFKRDGEHSGMSMRERRAAAKSLADRGHSRRVIAELLGIVISTVRRDLAWPNEPAHRVGPKKIYKPTRESQWLIGRRAAVQELAAKGHSRREIAVMLDIDKQKVSRDLRRANATAATAETEGRDRGGDGRYRRTASGDLRLPMVKKLAAEGHNAREIAGIVGVHLRTVFNDLKLLRGSTSTAAAQVPPSWSTRL